MARADIRLIFLDIGGVVLTNGWDHHMRRKAAEHFHLDYDEMEARHQPVVDAYETDRMTVEQYLDHIVFYRSRPFTKRDFMAFVESMSARFPETFDLMHRLKSETGLPVVALNNEAREDQAYRIEKFKLHEIFDFFVSSCYVHIRKPDPAIFRMALDLTQIPAGQSLYIEDREENVTVARDLGLRVIHHETAEETRRQLVSLGLIADDRQLAG